MADDTTITGLEARLAEARAPGGEPAALIDALNELAWELRLTDSARARVLATEARQLALEHGHKLGQARAARTMAMTPGDPGDMRAIFELAQEARRLFDEVGDGQGRAASRDFLASIHEYTGDLAGGLSLALDALSIAREIDDPIRQGYALSNVGGILAASGEVDEAVERLQEAVALFEGAGDPAGVETINFRLCKVLKEAGRLEEALACAAACREAAHSRQEEYARYAALDLMAQIEERRGRVDEALRLYRAALDSLTSDLALRAMGAETQVALGKLLTGQGALDAAERELQDALDRVEGEPLLIMVEAAAHEALAELYEARSQLAEAIAHLRQARALRERIARRDARNKAAQIEVRAAMEAAKQDAELHRLRFVELHEMQSKLVEAEKMALLGRLAAGAAHELNTPLGVLRSNAGQTATATRRLVALVRPDDSVQAEKLTTVLESCQQTSDEAVERIAAIAETLRRFTQLDQAERRAFDVREGLQSALALLRPTIPAAVTLERRLDEVPAIVGWPRELNHAFLTVLQNAAEAIDGAGTITVETGTFTVETGASPAEEQVLVRVRDTGRGMSEEQVAHLFDVTWSEAGTRTKMRLGLAAAYATVQKHGGALEVESAPGQGTVVIFRLPLPRP